MKTTETHAPPPLFRRHVRRPRLTRLLDDSTAQVIVITAPAGYGKTTLAAEWLQEKRHAAWYRATPGSADVAAFSVGVADAVAPFLPGAGERLKQRVRIGDAPEKAVRPLAELLAEDLREWPADAWLVIDDYHLVSESAPVEEFVDWLLTLAPLRLVVTTRRRPSWASARRLLYGEITEITREQLAMSNDEARRVLEGRSSDTVDSLVTEAEGWPALIGLAGLSTSEIPKATMSNTLFRYFAEELVRHEPPDVQRFMLLASIPLAVTAPLAREVLGFSDPEDEIHRLLSDGLLHESEGDRFRFHPLFRDFLRRKVQSLEPALTVHLSEKVIDYERTRHRWHEAFELALEAECWKMASDIAVDAVGSLLDAGHIETVERWISALGVASVQSSPLILARAEILIRKGALSEAVSTATDLAKRLPAENPNTSRAWYLAGHALHFSGDEEGSLRCHYRARDAARTRSDRISALSGAVAAACEVKAEEALTLARELANIAGDDLTGRLRLALSSFFAASRVGDLRGVANLFEPLIPLVQYETEPMAKSSFLATWSYLNVLRADYSQAHAFAIEATQYCTRLRLAFALPICTAYRVKAAIGLRAFSEAYDGLDDLSQWSATLHDPTLNSRNDPCE